MYYILLFKLNKASKKPPPNIANKRNSIIMYANIEISNPIIAQILPTTVRLYEDNSYCSIFFLNNLNDLDDKISVTIDIIKPKISLLRLITIDNTPKIKINVELGKLSRQTIFSLTIFIVYLLVNL